MFVTDVARLIYNNEILGFRIRTQDKNVFDILTEDLKENLGSDFKSLNCNSKDVRLQVRNGIFYSEAEITGDKVVRELVENPSYLKRVIEDLRPTPTKDLYKEFSNQKAPLNISDEVAIKIDNYRYKMLSIQDIINDFIAFSGAESDFKAYSVGDLYFEPDRDFWYQVMYVETEDTATVKIFAMKYGTCKDAVGKLNKFQGKKTTKQNMKLLNNILLEVKAKRKIIPLQFKCNWSGGGAFDKFDKGIQNKTLVWQA